MFIKDMFKNNINRKIDGVIQVTQERNDAIEQELNEYVITKELKKHFMDFFGHYADSFDTPTTGIGVWISGFFGSGKSHFLKMLSYILANKEVNGIKTVERFRKKFKEDSLSFADVDKSVRTPAETILFNIDVVGPVNKNATAVMRVFAKMFYNHIGFYGDNLNVVQLEKHLTKQGKYEEFKEEFEKINGASWVESRESYSFFEDDVVEAMKKVLGISEIAARNWFAVSDITELDSNMQISIENLVADMKEYVDSKDKDFRLVFMIDEVGQYIGTDTGMLLNLQSLVEEIGSKCNGKVWVICTGQEAIDQIIKVRADEFSRIQARFGTRLSLSSSSADEVIQKRILKKTPEAEAMLKQIYETQNYVLSNLFNFKNAIKDIVGYKSAEEFAVNFPFVPYQFIIMQKVFSEIRKHGNAGKHLSGGERSMLSGFQEAAQKVQEKEENAIVPFYMFYDTVHSFLDSTIRRVIERCEKAADDRKGVEKEDVNLLKLLYLIRYIDDVPATIENLVILMADDIRMDKINAGKRIEKSLERLIDQNYIARTGDVYNFLTDAEQDVEREIKEESITPGDVIKRMSEIIFDKIYTTKKFRYEDKYDFEFDKKVDGVNVGRITGGMELEILTVATNEIDKSALRLMGGSKKSAIIVFPKEENGYYAYLENALKISKFARKKNLSQASEIMKNIITGKNEDAKRYEEDAVEKLRDSIIKADVYIAGEKINISGTNPEVKINEALRQLVSIVYRFLDYVDKNVEKDSEILNLLAGNEDNSNLYGYEANRKASDEIERYLQMQQRQNIPTTMADIQKRYQAVPYGWREIDIAYCVARLIHEQKINLKYSGEIVKSDNRRIPDLLRKKSEIGKSTLSIREVVSTKNLKAAKEILREYFDVMDIPEDEDGIVNFINEKFTGLSNHYNELLKKYRGKIYPDRGVVEEAVENVEEILRAGGDNIALVKKILDMELDLADMKEDIASVDEFFNTQVVIFDEAAALEELLRHDMDYFRDEDAILDALAKIRSVVVDNAKKPDGFNYRDIPGLNTLMDTVRNEHARLLDDKKSEIIAVINDCMEELRIQGELDGAAEQKRNDTYKFFDNKRKEIDETETLALLDSFTQRIIRQKEEALKYIEKAKHPEKPAKPGIGEGDIPLTERVVKVERVRLFPAKTLKNSEEIDEYLKEIREQLESMLKDHDGIKIN